MTTYEFEQESTGMHAGRFIAGALFGALAGAVTLLLIAPHSGRDTRKMIETKAIELRDRTTATAGNVSGQVRSKAGQIKASVSTKSAELTRQGKQALARQLDRLSIAAKTGSGRLIGKSS
jgi:gas vesicle protein